MSDERLNRLRAIASGGSDPGTTTAPSSPIEPDRYSSDNPGIGERLQIGLGDLGRAATNFGQGAVNSTESLLSYLTGMGSESNPNPNTGLLQRGLLGPNANLGLPGLGMLTEAAKDYGNHVSSQNIENTLGELIVGGAFAGTPVWGPGPGIMASGMVPPAVRTVNEWRDPSLKPKTGDELTDLGMQGFGAGVIGELMNRVTPTSPRGEILSPAGTSVVENAARLEANRPGVYYEKLGLGNKGTIGEGGLRQLVVDPQSENLLFKEQLISKAEADAAVTPEQVQALHETFKTRAQDAQNSIIAARNDLLDAATALSKEPGKGMNKTPRTKKEFEIEADPNLRSKVESIIADDNGFLTDPVTGQTLYTRGKLDLRQAQDLKEAVTAKLREFGDYNPETITDLAQRQKLKNQTEVLEALRRDLDNKISQTYANIVDKTSQAGQVHPTIKAVLDRPEVSSFPYELEARTGHVPQTNEGVGDYAGVLSSRPRDMYNSLNARYSALADLEPIMPRLDQEMGQVVAPVGVRRLTQNDLGRDLADPKAGAARRVANAVAQPIDKLFGLTEKANAANKVEALTQGGRAVKELTDIGEIRLGRKELPREVLKTYPTVQNFLEKMTGAAAPLTKLFGNQTLLQQPTFLPPPPLRVEPNSKSVIENKDKLIEDISMKIGPDAPMVMPQIQQALDSKNPDRIGSTMVNLMHAYPVVRGIFGDDPTKPYVAFNKKVYTPEDKDIVERLIKDSKGSLLRQSEMMAALNKDGTVLLA